MLMAAAPLHSLAGPHRAVAIVQAMQSKSDRESQCLRQTASEIINRRQRAVYFQLCDRELIATTSVICSKIPCEHIHCLWHL